MIVTSLLGRKFEDYNKNIHTVVGVYLDRGLVYLIAENKEGGIWTISIGSHGKLLPEKKSEPAMH